MFPGQYFAHGSQITKKSISFSNDLPFDDDLPERRFDVGRAKEDAIQKAKQYLTTPAPAENIIAEQFILKENFVSKWTPVGKEPTILLPTIKPFQSLKD